MAPGHPAGAPDLLMSGLVIAQSHFWINPGMALNFQEPVPGERRRNIPLWIIVQDFAPDGVTLMLEHDTAVVGDQVFLLDI
jgi:hypothetical protein